SHGDARAHATRQLAFDRMQEIVPTTGEQPTRSARLGTQQMLREKSTPCFALCLNGGADAARIDPVEPADALDHLEHICERLSQQARVARADRLEHFAAFLEELAKQEAVSLRRCRLPIVSDTTITRDQSRYSVAYEL